VLGILGRAQELYGVGLCGYAFASSHYHLLLLVDTAKQLSDFMGYFNSNLAREAGRLVDWREKFWSRRYRAIVVSGEEGAQRERLKYVLSHGVGPVDDLRSFRHVPARVETHGAVGAGGDEALVAVKILGPGIMRAAMASRRATSAKPAPSVPRSQPEEQSRRCAAEVRVEGLQCSCKRIAADHELDVR